MNPMCPTCHLPILPEYYFCPNCGTNLRPAPLPMTFVTLFSLYAHSLILPFLAFITISKWKGSMYLKSADSQAKRVGMIALVLLILSTVGMVWSTYALSKSLSASLNETLSGSLDE